MSVETYQYITLISFKGSLSRGEEGSLCFGERGHFQLAKGVFLSWPDRVIFMCFIHFIIDPMALQDLNRAKHGVPRSTFNPLDHIEKDIFNGTAQIANLLIPDDPNGEKFWNQDARNLVQAILMHIMTENYYQKDRNLVKFYKLMLTEDMSALLNEMALNESIDFAIKDMAESFEFVLNNTPQTFSSIRAVANGAIKWLGNPLLQAAMKSSSFKPEDLEKGNTTLYLCQPIQNAEGFATFSRLIVGFCIRANSKPSHTPKEWVYYLLDEFPTMGVFPEVIQALAFSREYRMRIWIFSQSLSYLDWVYQQHGRNQILGCCGVVQVFGSTDYVTQEYISKRLGSKTVKVITRSISKSRGSNRLGNLFQINTHSSYTSGDGTAENESFHGIPLLSAEEVQFDKHIITITENGRMRLSRWQYWQNTAEGEAYYKLFSKRAAPNPNVGNF